MAGYIILNDKTEISYHIGGLPQVEDVSQICSMQLDGDELDEALSVAPSFRYYTQDRGKRVQTWHGASARRLYLRLLLKAEEG